MEQSSSRFVPSEHRMLGKKSTSSFGALAHLLKASLGAGVLAMPLAFKDAGLLVGVFGTAFIGLICCHAIHILVKTSQAVCVELKKPALTYADTCDLVFQHGPVPVRKFARAAKELVDWGLALTHAGACCVYVIVIAETCKQMVAQYAGLSRSVTLYCLLTLIVLIPLTQIQTLKYLVPFSALANLIWGTAISISIYYCLRSPPNLAVRNLTAPITGLPNFISTCLFAMECIGVVMPVENEMTHPEHFLGCPGVLNIAMPTVAILFGFVGFFGYWQYGETVQGSLTLNLPRDEFAAQLAKILVAVVMLLSFALIYYVPVDVAWRKVKNRVPDKNKYCYLAILRLAGTFLLVGLASALPSIPLFLELIGAICLSVMGLLLPVIIETVYRWDKDITAFSFTVIKNLLIGIFSIIALVSGTTFAILAMFKKE